MTVFRWGLAFPGSTRIANLVDFCFQGFETDQTESRRTGKRDKDLVSQISGDIDSQAFPNPGELAKDRIEIRETAVAKGLGFLRVG